MAKFFALVPAAGSGARMGTDQPKQYLPLHGRPLLYHTLQRLAACAAIERVFVVLAAGDSSFAQQDWQPFSNRLEPLYCGGATRAESVFNGLLAVRDLLDADDWVLVHDAVRPCLPAAALARLMSTLHEDAAGGLLALPVVDTIKRADAEGRVLQTESRESLWQAQTPQMFRYRVLLEALRAIDPAAVTDEASAIERLGLKPRLVMGDTRNLKVTYPHDLEMAAMILKGTVDA
jgi:2-C-methyl-D-erythritol 4-phosphate cytidylyltransferase